MAVPASCWANIRVEARALVRCGVGGMEERVFGAVEISFAYLRWRRVSSVGLRLGRGEAGERRVMGVVVGNGGWVVRESGDGGGGRCGEDKVLARVFDRRLRLWVSIRTVLYLLDSRSLLVLSKSQGLLLWKLV